MPILQPGRKRRKPPRTLVSWLWLAALMIAAAVIVLAVVTHG